MWRVGRRRDAPGSGQPPGREIDDVAPLVAFLSGPEARWITAQTQWQSVPVAYRCHYRCVTVRRDTLARRFGRTAVCVLVALIVACLAAIMAFIGYDWLNTLALLTFGFLFVAVVMIEFTVDRPPSPRVEQTMMAGYIVLASFAMAALVAGYYQIGCDRLTAVVTADGGHNDGEWIWSLYVTRTDSGEDIGYVMHSAEVAVGDEVEVYVDPRGWAPPVSGFWLPEALQYSAGIAVAALLGLFVMSALPRPGVVPPDPTSISADIPSVETPADSSGRTP